MDPVRPRRARWARRTVAIAATAALSLGSAFIATNAAVAAPQAGEISGATFSWSLSNEQGGGAFFGGCNYLVAGAAGDTGSSRLWTQADGFYKTAEGNVAVVKPNAAGEFVQPTWATKCQDANGTAVSAANTASSSKNEVRIANGVGAVAADGSFEVEWSGSFTSVFYGGLTYWTASNPVLTVDAQGNGQVTATASGYGADMNDTTKWVPLAPREIVLADLTGVAATDTGFVATPKYAGVVVGVGEGTPQNQVKAGWGSFPQSFVDFHQLTGQSSYWYTSGGARDAAKTATPITVAYALTPGTTDPEEPEVPATPGDQDIDVTIPDAEAPASGEFGWSFESNDAVTLGTATQAGSTFAATGALNTIKVSDTRVGGTGAYTWNISGQVSQFVSGTDSFSAGYLGWTPSVTNAGPSVVAGAQVGSTVSSGLGLGQAATLASSTAAASADIDAALSLVAPSSTPAGDYTATLTVTALS